MARVCPECGAVTIDGRSCQEFLHVLLAEMLPTGAAEYGLAVACYTLQHATRQNDKSLEWAYFHVSEFHVSENAENHLPLGEIHQRVRSRFDQQREPISALSLRSTLVAIQWRVNILELEQIEAQSNSERILIWAKHVVEEIHEQMA